MEPSGHLAAAVADGRERRQTAAPPHPVHAPPAHQALQQQDELLGQLKALAVDALARHVARRQLGLLGGCGRIIQQLRRQRQQLFDAVRPHLGQPAGVLHGMAWQGAGDRWVLGSRQHRQTGEQCQACRERGPALRALHCTHLHIRVESAGKQGARAGPVQRGAQAVRRGMGPPLQHANAAGHHRGGRRPAGHQRLRRGKEAGGRCVRGLLCAQRLPAGRPPRFCPACAPPSKRGGCMRLAAAGQQRGVGIRQATPPPTPRSRAGPAGRPGPWRRRAP